MAADVHHLDDGVFVGEVHIGYAAASGGVSGHAVIAWHYYVALVVAFDNEFAIFIQFLLLHGKFCRNHLAKRRNCLGKCFKNIEPEEESNDLKTWRAGCP